MNRERTILFVCQFNSARSQLAEAIARSLAPPGVRVLSAGLRKTIVNAQVLQALQEIGMDASGQWSKTVDEIAHERVDDVVILAEEAVAVARERFPNSVQHEWFMPDPVAEDEQYIARAVCDARDELSRRLKDWLRGRGTCSE